MVEPFELSFGSVFCLVPLLFSGCCRTLHRTAPSVISVPFWPLPSFQGMLRKVAGRQTVRAAHQKRWVALTAGKLTTYPNLAGYMSKAPGKSIDLSVRPERERTLISPLKAETVPLFLFFPLT